MSALFTRATDDSIYLLSIAAQPPGGAETTGRSDFGDLCWGEELPPLDVIVNTVTELRYASAEYRTLPTDTPANQEWPQRLTLPLALSRALPLAPGSPGIVALNFGEIELQNADEALDQIVQTYGVDGRQVVLRRVEPGASIDDAETVFTGTAYGWALADSYKVVLAVRGQAHRLNVGQQANTYAGTGDGEGDADLKNVPRPLAFGWCSNITPVRVSAFDQLFQVHDGEVQDIPMVYDGGVELDPGDDYASLALLLAASTAAGEFDTCLAEGYFKLGSNPVYDVTADVEGDAPAGDFAEDSAAIAERLLLRAGIDAGDIDAAGFAALSALQPAPVGYYLRGVATCSETVADLLGGIGAFLSETADGKFTVERLEAPTAAADTLDDGAYFDIGLAILPDEVSPTIWRLGVTWGVNWTPQAIQLDAANIPAARLAFINVAARIAVAFDTDRQAFYRQAQDYLGARPPVRAFFRDEADALAEAERLLALWAPGRQLLSLPVQSPTLERDIGDQITVYAARYGMNAGVPCRVFGTAFDTSTRRLVLQVLR